jgi:CHASE2 domain-containing sensor protein
VAERLNPAIARIYSQNGRVVGGGVLVSDRHVLTCAHVVASALGLPEAVQEKPTASVGMDFPGAETQRVQGIVCVWKPVQMNLATPAADGEDLAVLELEVPVKGIPLLRFESAQDGQRFRVFGFPEAQEKWSSGVISGRQANGWVQVQGEAVTGPPIQLGFSGAPVWNAELTAVLGIVVAANVAQPQYKDASIIPTEILRKAWPDLAPQGTDRKKPLSMIMGTSALVTLVLIVLRFLGVLEGLELRTFDLMLRSRLPEEPDNRIFIIELKTSDFPEGNPKSLPSSTLENLLKSVNSSHPRVISLDFNRSYINEQDPQKPSPILSKTKNLVAICQQATYQDGKVIEKGAKPYSEAEVPRSRIGFSNFANDANTVTEHGIVRRQKLIANPAELSPAPTQDDCNVTESFSLLLARRFLQGEGISYTPPSNLEGLMKFGNVEFPRVHDFTGGYSRRAIDDYQILLNYRSGKPADSVSLAEFLTNPQGYKSKIENRVVLIGVTASTDKFTDTSVKPSGSLAGVVIHAHMVSQLLSTVLDKRPLLWSFSEGAEYGWIFIWTGCGGGLGYYVRKRRLLGWVVCAALLAHGALCYLTLAIAGAWIPLIPSSLGFLMAGSILHRQHLRFQRHLHSK